MGAAAGLAVTLSRLIDWLSDKSDKGLKLKLGELERIAVDRNAIYDAAVDARREADAEVERCRRRCERVDRRLRQVEAHYQDLRVQLWQATGVMPPPLPQPEEPDDTEDQT